MIDIKQCRGSTNDPPPHPVGHVGRKRPSSHTVILTYLSHDSKWLDGISTLMGQDALLHTYNISDLISASLYLNLTNVKHMSEL